MDWSTILSYILKIAGSALAALITTFATILFTKLKTKINNAILNAYIAKVVRAAEQLYPNEGQKTGPEKFQYVVDRVLERFPKLTNNEYLRSLIEGAVYSVSQEVKQIAKIEDKEEKSETKALSSF